VIRRRSIKEKEYELEKNRLSFNEALSTNKALRKQINDLRKERSLFDKIYYNLEMDIMKKKDRLMKLIEEADKKDHQKNKQQAELLRLQSLVKEDKDIFQKNYKEVLNEFEGPIERLSYLKSEARERRTNGEGHDPLSDEMRRSKKTIGDAAHQDQGLMSKADREQLEQYTAFFNTLFEDTQMNDVDEIIAAFKKADRDHGRIFNEILATNKEIEEIENQISDEKKRMAQLKQLSPEEMQKLGQVNHLETEIKRNEQQIDTYNNKITSIMRNVQSFRVASCS